MDHHSFLPHGFCLGWPGPPAFPPWLVILHIMGDLGGVVPYLLLASGVAWWLSETWLSLPQRWRAIGCSTVAFLALCGMTHAMDILVLVWSVYRLQAAIKISMGIAAGTALCLSWLEIPRLKLAQAQLYIRQLGEELRDAAADE